MKTEFGPTGSRPHGTFLDSSRGQLLPLLSHRSTAPCSKSYCCQGQGWQMLLHNLEAINTWGLQGCLALVRDSSGLPDSQDQASAWASWSTEIMGDMALVLLLRDPRNILDDGHDHPGFHCGNCTTGMSVELSFLERKTLFCLVLCKTCCGTGIGAPSVPVCQMHTIPPCECRGHQC